MAELKTDGTMPSEGFSKEKKGSGRLCRKLPELYELIDWMVRTLGREYDQQITERHSPDRAERRSGQAIGLLTSQ